MTVNRSYIVPSPYPVMLALQIRVSRTIVIFFVTLALDTMGEEERCGRPLAVRFIDEKLYVMDAFFGLYQLDITGGM